MLPSFWLGLHGLPTFAPKHAGDPLAHARRPGAWAVLGLDFLVDEDLRLRFVEANLSPGMANHGVAGGWKRAMGRDLLAGGLQLARTLHETPETFRMKARERFFARGADLAGENWWELAFNEADEKCHHQQGERYDPCRRSAPEF